MIHELVSGSLRFPARKSVEHKGKPVAYLVCGERKNDPTGYPHAACEREELAAVAHDDGSQGGKEMKENRTGHDPDGHCRAEYARTRSEEQDRGDELGAPDNPATRRL